MRVQATPDAEVKVLLNKHLNVNYQSLNDQDEVWIKHRSDISFNATKPDEQRADNYLKVPFKEALSLVGRRQVFINKGFAFVPIRELS